MKKISFRALKLTNFKNFKNKLFIFGDESTSFAGANGSGKTTMIDAVSWLLTGKDSKDRANVEFLPLGKDGQIIHDLPASVELKIIVDGEEHKLRRTLAEIWTKKRGSSEAVLTGRSNSYEFDEAPIKTEKDFGKLVSDLFDVNQAIMVSRPDYFPNMEWKDQREMLLKLSGFKDEDVIAANKNFEELKGKNIELTKSAAEKNQKETVKKINELAIAIKTINETLPENYDFLQQELLGNNMVLRKAKTERQAILEKNAAAKAGTDLPALKERLSTLEKELVLAHREYDDANKGISDGFEEKRNNIRKKIADAETGISKTRVQIEAKNAYLTDYKKALDKLRKDYMEISHEPIKTQSNICPTCGQELSEELMKKVFGDANERKAAKLKEISTLGKEKKAETNQISIDIQSLEKSVETLNEAIANGNKQITELHNQERDVFASLDKFEDTADYKDITKEQEEIKQQLLANKTVPEVISTDEIDETIKTLEEKKASIAAAQKSLDQLNSYKAKQEACTKQLGQLDKEIALIDDFIRTRCDMISDAVNKKFSKVQFKLFDNQINGGVRETCELTMNGTPFRSLSTAEKIQAGLDVIKTLQEFFGLSFPIFVDNHESVSEIPETDSQIINLFVNPEYKDITKI